MNTCYFKILQFNYRSECLKHLSEQNTNFGNAQKITTENALTDLYIYLFGTKIIETIDMAAVQQTLLMLCHAVSFKAINPKMPSK